MSRLVPLSGGGSGMDLVQLTYQLNMVVVKVLPTID